MVKLDQAKSAELKAKHFGKGGTEDSNVHTTKTERGGDGSTTTTNVTTSRRTTKGKPIVKFCISVLFVIMFKYAAQYPGCVWYCLMCVIRPRNCRSGGGLQIAHMIACCY